ncbi:hypothetical protein, partial [Metasolibacillus sp.]|uniref:hypothetical protein n=1 Tax=Metasolibacillus sp. TaxID=2703680 RepID=UPI0025D80E67
LRYLRLLEFICAFPDLFAASRIYLRFSQFICGFSNFICVFPNSVTNLPKKNTSCFIQKEATS